MWHYAIPPNATQAAVTLPSQLHNPATSCAGLLSDHQAHLIALTDIVTAAFNSRLQQHCPICRLPSSVSTYSIPTLNYVVGLLPPPVISSPVHIPDPAHHIMIMPHVPQQYCGLSAMNCQRATTSAILLMLSVQCCVSLTASHIFTAPVPQCSLASPHAPPVKF